MLRIMRPASSHLLHLSLAIAAVLLPHKMSCQQSSSRLEEAEEFFAKENELMRQRRHKEYLVTYAYNTNVTEENRQAMIAAAAANTGASKELARRIKELGYDKSDNENIRRQALMLSDIGYDILDEQDYKRLQEAISAMQTNYAKVTACRYENPSDCSLVLEPHIQDRMAQSRDPKELAHYWKEWYDKAGTPMRENFTTYIQLSKKAANMNNYSSMAEYWIHFYEDPDFEKNLDEVYEAILPLYKEIHAYVRHRLRQYYGAEVVPEKGPIPMHLLGNMWAQQWDETAELYMPYADIAPVDVTKELNDQGYTVRKLFELADQFFQSLNLRALPASFWDLSVLERPTDRDIVCHASAWDLYENSDVRIKMCTELTTHYFYVVHHEMGHIQYYLQYEHQPTVYRTAPNPGFHEAVGDVIALSVSTPRHLHAVGLCKEAHLDEKQRINELFVTALKKIVFLPFAYWMDKYRYGVFRGEIPESEWNRAFWRMREEMTGLVPPVERTDSDFDPPAKYHVDADVEYLRYFAAHIFQFQFHKAMCLKAGVYNPEDPHSHLDNCDFFRSKEAGEAFSKFLSKGASQHWKPVLKEFTGEDSMNPSAILEYFAPLQKWLAAENKRLGVTVGW